MVATRTSRWSLVLLLMMLARALPPSRAALPRHVLENGVFNRRTSVYALQGASAYNSQLTAELDAKRAYRRSRRRRTWLEGPVMTNAEKNRILMSLHPDQSMIEWGSGGSTVVFSPLVAHFHSIEHSGITHRSVKTYLHLSPRLTYTLREVKPGHLGWRGRLQPGTFKQFRSYVTFIDEIQARIKAGSGSSTFDRVLVDGRARVACAVYALRHLAPNSLVFIHDFFKRADSRQYRRVFDYYDQVQGIHSLVVLKPKPQFVGKAIPDNEIHGLYSWYTGQELPPGSRR